jgi:hypothetical protein
MCVVMNLERRMHRRRWMELMCANALRALAPEVEFLCAVEQNELRIEDDTVASARDFARSAPLSKTRSNRCCNATDSVQKSVFMGSGLY